MSSVWLVEYKADTCVFLVFKLHIYENSTVRIQLRKYTAFFTPLKTKIILQSRYKNLLPISKIIAKIRQQDKL